ncbi:hypothetical protein [Rhodopirellula bahusiensis]|uniref:Uncharacterized protein n=1 Tax=Rhodopirellula bahusiensis TaxID=2014065 RepID=A0A2G1W376_9BACT|nr:hypothetical protein [Rhodopirellula bahusiensis]PHQ33119.1 hypothetical protein CEE69_21910 [Rhodopirellula bahusiensis]
MNQSGLDRKQRLINRFTEAYHRDKKAETLIELMKLHIAIGKPNLMLGCVTLFLAEHSEHPLRDAIVDLSLAAATEDRSVSSRLEKIKCRSLTRRYDVLLREHLG